MSIVMHTLTDKNGRTYQVSDGIFRQLLGVIADDEVPPGGKVVVPTMLRDGQPPTTDARFIPPTTDQLQAVEDARQEWIARTCNAWKGNAATPSPVADSTPRRGDLPTMGKSNSTPQPKPTPRQPVHDEREQAYADYIRYLTNAWRTGGQ